MTCLSADGTIQVDHVPASSERSCTIRLEWLNDDVVSVARRLSDDLAHGGCVAWICNTVSRAQEVYTTLKHELGETDIELELFHARFPLGRRVEIEKRVLKRYGKDDASRPHKSILVATQVVEQSLDLDFDLMLTELAPVDLVLQRAGRMHRHKSRKRSPCLKSPVLYLFKPHGHEADDPKFGWSPYDEYILLRSWLALRTKSHLAIPGDVQLLIEQVYGDEHLDTPENLKGRLECARAKSSQEINKAENKAKKKSIPSPDDDFILDERDLILDEDNPDVHEALKGLTRLCDPSVTVVFLRNEKDVVLPNESEARTKHVKWVLEQSISLSYPNCVYEFPSSMVPPTWEKEALLRHVRAVVCPNSMYGTKTRQIALDAELGCILRLMAEEER